MARQEDASRVTATHRVGSSPKRARGTRPAGNGTPEEVAEHLQIPAKTLAEWRSRGTGPAFMKVGRYVRYRWADVLAWEETRVVRTA